MQIVCKQCGQGILYDNQERVLKDGTVVYKEKCTNCDHSDEVRIEPEMFQYKQRAKVTVTKEEKQREFEKLLAEKQIPKFIFDLSIESLSKNPDSWRETQLVNKGDPVLSHSHHGLSVHPVSQKHKNLKSKTVIAVKKYVYKNGKKYGPYPKNGHYFYEVWREGKKIKQKFLYVNHDTELKD